MGTRVYDVDVQNPHFDINDDVRTHSRIRYTVWVNENKVTIGESKYLTGINHRNIDKKRWWRWRSVAAYGFMRTKTGLAQPFEVKRQNMDRGVGWTNVVPVRAVNSLSVNDEISNAYKEQLAKTFGFTEFNELYPMAATFGIDKFQGIPIGIRMAFREPSINDFTRHLFGVKRTNDALVGAVADTDPYFIALAHQYRGFVPDQMLVDFMLSHKVDDELENVMNEAGRHGSRSSMSPCIRKSLNLANEETARNLITEEFDSDAFNHLASISVWNTNKRSMGRANIKKDKTYKTLQEFSSGHYR